MSSSIEKPILPSGDVESGPEVASEANYSLTNPGPLFKSAWRVIVFALMVGGLLTLLDTLHIVHPPNIMFNPNWRDSYMTPEPPREPVQVVCCIGTARLKLAPGSARLENCLPCVDTLRYRDFVESGRAIKETFDPEFDFRLVQR